MNNHIKSFIKSKTIQAIVVMFIGGLIPVIDKISERRELDLWEDVPQVIIVSLGAIVGVVGRIQANSLLYTPNGIVGPNKRDLELKIEDDLNKSLNERSE